MRISVLRSLTRSIASPRNSGGAQQARRDIADDANLSLQYQHGAVDQSSAAHRFGAGDAACERLPDLNRRERTHPGRNEALAEIARLVELAGRRPLDGRVVEIDRVPDQRRRGVGGGTVARENRRRICDAAREAAPPQPLVAM